MSEHTGEPGGAEGAVDGSPAGTAQGALFDLPTAIDPEGGYRGPTACAVAGISYRQLDYWARTHLVVPSVRPAHGSGSQRLYSFRDIIVLKIVKRLLEAGVSLQNIRAAVEQLRVRATEDLASITLISDGTTVYECRSPEEVIDLLQGGQAVFGIAVAGTLREVEGHLAEFPAELPDGVDVETGTTAQAGPRASAAERDELALRRSRRNSA